MPNPADPDEPRRTAALALWRYGHDYLKAAQTLCESDRVTCDEGRGLLGEGLTTVAVKEGTGRFGARNLAPKRARELIEEGAKQALKDLGTVPPYDPGRPCEIRVVFHHSDGVDDFRWKPAVEIVGPREIVSRADDWWSAWQQFFF